MTQIDRLRVLADYQQYEQLLTECQPLSGDRPPADGLPLLALAGTHTHRYTDARQWLEQALAQQADYAAPVRTDLAAVLITHGRFAEAEAQLEQALTQQPDYAPAIARLGYCRWSQGDTTAARAQFERAIALAPDRLATLNNLVALCLQLDDRAATRHWLAQAYRLLAELTDKLPPAALSQQQALLDGQQLHLWILGGQFERAEQWLDGLSAEQQSDAVCQYGRQLAAADHHDQASEVIARYLKQTPDSTELCLLQAELAQLQGYTLQAVQLLRRALRQDQDNIALWLQLSGACVQGFDEVLAQQASEKALALASALPDDDASRRYQLAQANTALAQVDSQAQRYATAQQRFDAVLAEHPDFLPALSALGQQKMQQGRIEEAVALFERVQQLDPIKGQLSLINARRFPEDAETLAALEQAAKTPSLEGSLRSSILFQLAAAWEKRKDHDKAFELARQANDASRKFLHYNARVHRNQCARIRMAFCRALYEHRPGYGSDSTLPVYVVGMPRSGTTLVEQILAGHSEIFGAGELGVIPQRIQGLERWERHTGSDRHYPDCVDDLTQGVTRGIADGILKELQDYAPEARHVVDKLPHNFENIGLIKFLFPHAKIISVRRDPRDIALSNYFTDYQAKHGGMGFAYDLTDIGEQLADHNLLMHHWHQTFPGEILEINYEDVVEDLEGCARRMLDYIGVDWQPQVLKFNELDRPVKTASVWQVRQPVYKTSKAKWKRYEQYLAPLIQGTNARIEWDPIDDMITLPEPGFLTEGMALYHADDLDGAELSFKKMLHHNPEHAACTYMVGLIYLRKHHLLEGIELLEQATAKAPWHQDWRENLARAYRLTGQSEKADALDRSHPVARDEPTGADGPDVVTLPDFADLPDGQALLSRNV
ncbi:tetratricopeptide repeat-containing sulfotransferase family protein [Marinobacterium arenosum]|uniref:tetratricopeptide repeat-containing sulfotransferase family protein n=1 Tax=Marinobacterium arenosum TaxID=2862496 RepID=UPI001C95163E|nr:tetratricopeptide repeat-containing sulfotransferase family protein [Marinobacterium arenosum]MBY4677658.1 sulfotransferase [Marinobacterium arenosum]